MFILTNSFTELFKNNSVKIYYKKEIENLIRKFTKFIIDYPSLLHPVKGFDLQNKEICEQHNFVLHSTVKRTTLLYDIDSGCFCKILHILKPKNRLFNVIIDKSKVLYRKWQFLTYNKVKLPEIMGYGNINKNKIIYIYKKIEGMSLYEIALQEKVQTYILIKVLDEMIKLHQLKYWFGDFHPSHVIIFDEEIKGFIDIDSIRKVILFPYKCYAKDLAGFFHPILKLEKSEQIEILKNYFAEMEIGKIQKFLNLIEYYRLRKWRNE